MKRFLLLLCLFGVFFVSSSYAQMGRGGDHNKERLNPELIERELELQERKLKMGLHKRREHHSLGRTPCRGPGKMMNNPGRSPKCSGGFRKQMGGCPMKSGKGHAMKMICPFLMLMLIMVVHILLAVWVYKDIRKKGSESGIWIIITLITGLFGTAVYALVRIGDSKK